MTSNGPIQPPVPPRPLLADVDELDGELDYLRQSHSGRRPAVAVELTEAPVSSLYQKATALLSVVAGLVFLALLVFAVPPVAPRAYAVFEYIAYGTLAVGLIFLGLSFLRGAAAAGRAFFFWGGAIVAVELSDVVLELILFGETSSWGTSLLVVGFGILLLLAFRRRAGVPPGGG